jgi:malonyl-CoA O-methyltransferase
MLKGWVTYTLSEQTYLFMSANSSLEKSELLPPLDPVAAKRWERIAAQSPAAWLHDEVAKRMAQRLGFIRSSPAYWVHWQPSLGGWASQAVVSQQYPQATCTVIESSDKLLSQAQQKLAVPWWKRWRQNAPRFALSPTQPAQLVWANMGLHMQARPQDCMAQWQASLAPEGFVMFSCLGPDTLRSLKNMYTQLGWPPAAHDFTDMHDWGDMLLASGFAQPIMDMEHITLTYPHAQALLADLRSLGRNLHPQRFAALRGKKWLAGLHKALQDTLITPQSSGRLALRFEIIYGHAFKAPDKALPSEITRFSVNDLRSQLPSKRQS